MSEGKSWSCSARACADQGSLARTANGLCASREELILRLLLAGGGRCPSAKEAGLGWKELMLQSTLGWPNPSFLWGLEPSAALVLETREVKRYQTA